MPRSTAAPTAVRDTIWQPLVTEQTLTAPSTEAACCVPYAITATLQQ